MTSIPLTALARSKDQHARALRKADTVPCVLYGNAVESTSLQCMHKDLLKAYTQAGESTLVNLSVDGKKEVPVLFHMVDMDPVTGKFLHVDFYAVDMKKEIEAPVSLVFEGESPAVKDLGGIFVVTRDHLNVKCLPIHLPHNLKVHIDSLAEFDSSLSVSDIQLPEGVAILEKPDTVIAIVQEPRKEEEIVPPTPEAGAEGAEAAAEGTPAEGAAEGEGAEKSDEKKESKK